MLSGIPPSQHRYLSLKVPKHKGTISCWSQVPLPSNPAMGLSIIPALTGWLQKTQSILYTPLHLHCTRTIPKTQHPGLTLTLCHPYLVNLTPLLQPRVWHIPQGGQKFLRGHSVKAARGASGLYCY